MRKLLIPRISTRGYYSLDNGKKLSSNSYFLYPKKQFAKLYGKKELAIMIHGLRNDPIGAISKFAIAKKTLKKLGYVYPVIGYTYDANPKGAHLARTELKALRVGQKIAAQNGANLAQFIIDFKKQSPGTKIRLLGHSLGTEVILSTLKKLASKKNSVGIVESVHFFGSSVKGDASNFSKYKKVFQKTVKRNIKNYYAPTDEVLRQSHLAGHVKNPLGLYGTKKSFSKYIQRKVKPKNHRFVSYAAVLSSFP